MGVRARRFWLALAVALAACGDDGMPTLDSGMDAGGDADSSVDTAVDTAPDASPRGCRNDSECADERCVDVLGGLGLGTAYCSPSCTGDADCDALDGEYDYRCVATAGESVCMRGCAAGFGCPDGHVCLVGQPTGGGNRADLCVDLRIDACESGDDCPEEAECTFLYGDRERVVKGCFVPRDLLGDPVMVLGPSATCDPASDRVGSATINCNMDDMCPADWTCHPVFNEYQACVPPREERCGLPLELDLLSGIAFACTDPERCGCVDEGYCAGLCANDGECGAAMRCSSITFASVRHGTPERYDDLYETTGFCSYAVGSRTPCVREADCASTGAGGARETCKVDLDATGAVGPVCVEPPPAVVLPGEACGDDPATPEHDERPCINHCLAGVCAGACSEDADCATGSRCLPHLVDATNTATLCTPVSPACERDADCASGEVCRLVITATGAHGVCGIPLGELAPGAACDVFPSDIAVESLPPSAECAAHACRTIGDDNPSGFCTTLCRDDADCPGGFACSTVEETIDGRGTLARDDDLTASWRECEYRSGSGNTCVTTADCPVREACFATADAAGTPIRVCVEGAFPTGIGEPCLVGCFAPFGCVTDWLTNERYCTELCGDDADCGGSGLVCRGLLDERTNVDRTVCIRPDDPRGTPL